MFCRLFIVNALQFLFNNGFHLLQQYSAVQALLVALFELYPVLPDEGFRLTAADTFVVGLSFGCEPLSPTAAEPVPAIFLQIAAELGLAVRGVFRGSRHGVDHPPVRFERLLPGAEPPQEVVDHRHLVTEHEAQTRLIEREPFKGSLRSSVFALSGRRRLCRLRPSRIPFPVFHLAREGLRVALLREYVSPQSSGDSRCRRLR